MREIYILGAKINDLSLTEAVDKVRDQLATDKKGYLVTPNPEICLISYKDKQFRRILQHSFISIPDGFGLKIGAFIFGQKLNNVTTGSDLVWQILKLAEHKKYSVLILGSKQDIGLRALKNIVAKYPELTIQYINGGSFDSQGNSNDQNLIPQINHLMPDIIFVCLGAPKQEYFMSQNIKLLNAKLLLGVGGSIDFIAGGIKRAPISWRKIGLEWLWRLIQEPWRWKRIIKAVIIFPLACLWWRFRNIFFYRINVVGFIINKQKKILITKHARYSYWQFPQGGAKKSKTKQELEAAVLREMKDELGTDNFKVLKMLKNCYKYRWPKNKIGILLDKFKGQKQTLFLLEFLGDDNEIKLSPYEHRDWQWVNKDEILDKVVEFKKPIVKIGLDKFKQYL